MGIAKFDDSLPQGPKFLKAGPLCCWLWFASVCYSHRTLTDGFIPKEIVPTLVVGLSQPFKYATKLVEVGLWDDAVGGYQVHDYLHWNPSKAQVEGYRANDKDRKQKERAERSRPDGRPNGQSERTSNPPHSTTHARTHADAKSSSESLSSSEDQGSWGESAREGAQPVWSQQGGARGSGLVGNHRGCFHGPGGPVACERGLCIPGWLGAKWTQQYGADRAAADEEISAFIYRTVSNLPPGPVGDVEKDFWQAAWKERHGSQAPKPAIPSRTGDSIDAAKFSLKRRLEKMAAEEGVDHGPHALKG